MAAREPDPVAGAVVARVAVRARPRQARVERPRGRPRSARGSPRPSPARPGRRPRGRSGTPPASRRPRSNTAPRHRHGALPDGGHVAARARSPTRSRGTQSRGARAAARAGPRAAAASPTSGSAANSARDPRERVRLGQRGVVVEEEQQVAAHVPARRRCGRPGCPRPRAARRRARPSGSPVGLPAVADHDDVHLDARWREQRLERGRQLVRPPALRQHDAAERRLIAGGRRRGSPPGGRRR